MIFVERRRSPVLAALVVSLSMVGGVACTPQDLPSGIGNPTATTAPPTTTPPDTTPPTTASTAPPTARPPASATPGPTTAPPTTVPPLTSVSPTPPVEPPPPTDPTVGPRPVSPAPATGSGRAYFVDSARGDDSAAGTSPSAPWRTLTALASRAALVRGSTINLARGSSWSTPLTVAAAGVTVQPYGAGGAAPVISVDGWGAVQVSASDVVVQGIEVRRAKRGVWVQPRATRVTVRDTVAAGTGIGVYVEGSGNLVTHNDVHDGVMVVNTRGGGDDYGATGYWAQGAGNEWSYNTGTNLDQPSFDYGRDGGFIEIYAPRQNIHHNRSRNTMGFMEISENGDGVTVSENTINDPGGIVLATHVLLNGVRIERNVIVNAEGRWQLLLTDKAVRSGSDLTFNDNDVTSTVPLAGPNFARMTHTGNTYRAMRTIGLPLQAGERSI